MATFTIRDVADEIVPVVDLAATAAGFRSREAFLRADLERRYSSKASATYQLSERFRWLLDNMFDLAEKHHFRFMVEKPSFASIARRLNHDDVSRLEAMYRGNVPISFADGDRLCEVYGVSRQWLDTGDGYPFSQPKKHRDAGDTFAEWYRNGIPYERAFFVLEDAPRGEVAVFAPLSEYRYELVFADVPCHSDVGGTGTGMLRDLCFLLATLVPLKRAETNIMARAIAGDRGWSKTYLSACGLVLPREQFRALVYGEVHPAAYLDAPGLTNNPWFEDLPDLEYGKSDETRYCKNWTDAHRLFVQNMSYERVETNIALLEHVYLHRIRYWQPTDFDLVRTIQSLKSTEQSWEEYDSLLQDAKTDPDSASRKILYEIFDGNRRAMPAWLTRDYIGSRYVNEILIEEEARSAV